MRQLVAVAQWLAASWVVACSHVALVLGFQPCCSNCGKPFAEHCTKHVIPCCPGRCR